MTPRIRTLQLWAWVLSSSLWGVSACGNNPPVPVTPGPIEAGQPAQADALVGRVDMVPPADFRLTGFFDLHTHPLSNLGFAGKLVFGGPDGIPGGGAMMPALPDCTPHVRARSVDEALGHDGCTHASWGVDLNPLDLLEGKPVEKNHCGDLIRQLVVRAVQSYNVANDPAPDADGYPDFKAWPAWNDITHQSMWIDWIRRTHDAGLSVMVALTVNNETLADSVAGPGDGPDDDMTSSDLQIAEIKNLVSRHSDWMEIAYSSADLRRIVYNGRLAVVLGLEVDNIGDFNRKTNLSHDDITREIARLKDEGVRYLFPVHLIDNRFGTTAAYQDIFNLSNLREAGHFWHLVCAPGSDHINYQYKMGNPLTETVDLNPGSPLVAEIAGLMVVKLGMLSDTFDSPTVPPNCPGMKNVGVDYPGLTPDGTFAISEMMSQGMLIDIDHMSEASVDDALAIAVSARYPVNAGHNSIRSDTGGSERNLTREQYALIGKVHGMAGVGGARTDDAEWVERFRGIVAAMGVSSDAVGFGTDADGLAPMMKPPATHHVDYTPDFRMSTLGRAAWDYNDAGVAHYGMLADFVKAVPAVDGGATVVSGLMRNAQYFYETWKMAEDYAAAHGGRAVASGAAAASATPVSGAAPAAPATRLTSLARSTAAAPTAPQCPSGTLFATACAQCLRPGARCSLPLPECGPGRTKDKWGICKSVAAKKAVATAGLANGPTLAPGAYTLVLSESAPSASGRKVAGFDVEVAANGRRVTLREHGSTAAAPVPKTTGGFRGDRFTMRIDAGEQVLMLRAMAPSTGKVTEVRGAYVSHTPGQPGVTGVFFLTQTSTFSRTPAGVQPFDRLGGFLSDLRK